MYYASELKNCHGPEGMQAVFSTWEIAVFYLKYSGFPSLISKLCIKTRDKMEKNKRGKMNLKLRKIEKEDLPEYKHWKLPNHKYHEFNGPYFRKATKKEVAQEIKAMSAEFEKGNEDPLPNKMMITNEDKELLGEVNWYWKSEETNWLEIGVVIFDERNWGKGIGYQALKLWIEVMFKSKKEIVRIGLTTWSGNQGMIRLSEKLGMIKEAHYRKARIVKGKYYDSISYGILREEWEKMAE